MSPPTLLTNFVLCLIAAIFTGLQIVVAQDVQHHTMVGIVRDEAGQAVASASVFALAHGSSVSPSSATTDLSGHFSMQLLPGEFALVAAKEADDFPDCRLRYFLCDVVNVTISDSGQVQPVNLRVRKAARVIGFVYDENSKEPVSHAVLLIRRGDDFYNGYQTNIGPQFSILLPANTELSLMIVAFKYRWYEYRDSKTGDATLKLASGTHFKLDVALHRVEP